MGWINPLPLLRWAWLHGRSGWKHLWQAPGPNARFFVGTLGFWSVGIALIGSYKSLYLQQVFHLDNFALGGVSSLEIAPRVLGVLGGGLLAQRFGHKRMLLVVDFISWTIPCLVLGLATQPWHVYLAAVLSSTNALLAGSVVQMLVDDTPPKRRASTFATWHMVLNLPSMALPLLVGLGVERWGLEPTMRVMFTATAALTLTGILWRRVALEDSPAHSRGSSFGDITREAWEALKHLRGRRLLLPIVGSYLAVSCWQNLGGVYGGPFITRSLGLSEAWPGILGAAGAAAFALASLALVPRLGKVHPERTFFWASALMVPALLAPAFFRSGPAMLAAGIYGAVISAVHLALLRERVSHLLPRGREGLGQSLVDSFMLGTVALALLGGGALFNSDQPHMAIAAPAAKEASAAAGAHGMSPAAVAGQPSNSAANLSPAATAAAGTAVPAADMGISLTASAATASAPGAGQAPAPDPGRLWFYPWVMAGVGALQALFAWRMLAAGPEPKPARRKLAKRKRR